MILLRGINIGDTPPLLIYITGRTNPEPQLSAPRVPIPVEPLPALALILVLGATLVRDAPPLALAVLLPPPTTALVPVQLTKHSPTELGLLEYVE